MAFDLRPLPDAYPTTRDEIRRVAVHVLARRRHRLCGKFGLRAAAGGIGTPACWPEHEVVRISGTWLVREWSGDTARASYADLRGLTLAGAAAFADVELTEPFSVGHDTPPPGDGDAPLAVDADAAHCLGEWYRFGAELLDAVAASVGPGAEPSVVQLWPEHFDIACDVAAAPGRRVNLGASPGDAHHPDPYVYVGPWDADRPADPGFWNAPFGAVLGHDRLRSAPDPLAAAVDFLATGLRLLGG